MREFMRSYGRKIDELVESANNQTEKTDEMQQLLRSHETRLHHMDEALGSANRIIVNFTDRLNRMETRIPEQPPMQHGIHGDNGHLQGAAQHEESVADDEILRQERDAFDARQRNRFKTNMQLKYKTTHES